MADDVIDNDCKNCELNGTDSPETEIDIDTTTDVSNLKVAPLSSNPPIKYAPVMPPVKGNYDLYCVVLKWKDNPGESVSSASNACRQAAQDYKQLSGGQYILNLHVKHISVDLNHAPKNLNAAESQAKRQIGAKGDNNLYAIFNNHLQSVSHGSGDTAHLTGSLTRDVLHELGHCRPTKLEHSGKYLPNGHLDPYGDGTSFMGKFGTDKLTGAQLYLLGWLPQNKVAQYDIGRGNVDYNVQNLYGSNDGDSVKVVLIPRGEQRPLYLSMPQINGKPTLCLHLSKGRGTQRVAVFGNKASYGGLLFQKVSDGKGFVTVRISADQ